MKNIVNISISVLCFSFLFFLASCEEENLDQQVTVPNGQNGGGEENFCEELTGANDNYPSGFIGAECWTTNDEQGTISEDCACVVGTVDFDCPDLQLNFEDDCQTGAFVGYVNSDCDCVEYSNQYDCPGLQANIGDGCTSAGGNSGVVNSNCECEENVIVEDCPGLGNIGDPCQGGWGTVSADCDCVENQSQLCPIDGKWLLENAGGAELPPNTMYEFIDGIRYTYYCTDGASCDWAGMTLADAIPGTNDYTFVDNVLTVDLNFGNESVNDVEFSCECNVIDLQFVASSWTWWRIGTDPDDCN